MAIQPARLRNRVRRRRFGRALGDDCRGVGSDALAQIGDLIGSVLLGRKHVQERLRDLAKDNRISDELLADHGGTGGCANAFMPSGSIWVATLVPMPLKESRRDLLPEPDADKSS